VRRQGAAQIALVGQPNAGKSSLLQALSNVQIKTGDYAFTTTRPVPAVTRAGGVLVQLVEIPGLIAGASEGRGGGRALLGVLRTADAMVLCHDLCEPPERLIALRAELEVAGVDLPAIVAATKADEAGPGAVDALVRCVTDLAMIEVSILADNTLEALREAIWSLTGLTRVFLRHDGTTAPRAGRAAAAGHRGRRRPHRPPRARHLLPGCPALGCLGPVPRPVGRTQPSSRRRRHGRGHHQSRPPSLPGPRNGQEPVPGRRSPAASRFARSTNLVRIPAWSFLLRGGSDQIMLECERAGSGAGGDAELGEDFLHVPGDGVLADDQRGSDFAVGLARRDECQQFDLASGQNAIPTAGRPESRSWARFASFAASLHLP
jgi:small GTP-binding protein